MEVMQFAGLDPEAQACVRREVALAARAQEQGGRGYQAHLQLSMGGRLRDVLLGEVAALDLDPPIVRWQSAPLAGALFVADEGEEFELEGDGRRLAGVLVSRALTRFVDGRLVEVARPGFRALLEGGVWTSRPPARPELPARDALARKHKPSPMAVTLDPAQRALVEAPAGESLLVLGEAGYGKTTVALHRAAWLSRQVESAAGQALVIVPTPGLARLCARALERLDAAEVEVKTFAAWIEAEARRVFPWLPKRLGRGASPAVVRLKRHPALARAVAAVAEGSAAMRELGERGGRRPARRRDLLHLLGDRALLEDVVAASAGELRPGVIDEVIARTRLQFTSPTERSHRHVDADRLRTLDGRPIDDGTPTEDAGTIDLEDLSLLFAINHARLGRDRGPGGALGRYRHVVIDEAQELAPVELAVLGRARDRGGALTISGDERQRVADPEEVFRGWDTTLADLGRPRARRARLTESYRCPPAVERLARALFSGEPAAVRAAGPVQATAFHGALPLCVELCASLAEFTERDPRATVAIVARDASTARRLHHVIARGLPAHLALAGDVRFAPGVQVTTTAEVRGLEFDVVVVPDLDPAHYPPTDAARRALYVAVTRTTHALWLCTPGAWSPLVAAAEG
ncbi:MAG: AAA family ATPase [Myxococcales bacterium]|nr:AAA family ATPase [Myxococcales bacterium]